MNVSALDRLESATLGRWAPPPRLTVSEWADAHRMLSPESSASPGRWRTSTTPYLREIQDALRDPRAETVVFLKSAQIGATESLLNMLLYTLANDPGPAMYIMPTLELAGAFSKDRLQPAIRDCAVIRKLVGAPRSRDADNSILRKGVGGAVLTIGGSNSPASLSSRPVRLVLADEIDRFPASVGAEGDPLALAIKRTTAFRRRKILVASTPTVKGASRIEDWWEVSDKRLFHTPCPRCGVPFVIEWPHVRWDTGDPASAYIECATCGGRVEDTERPAMLAAGEWKPTAPFTGVRGYRAWEVVAPWRRLSEIVTSFLVAKRSIETLRVWRNTCVAELWEAPGESIEPSHLMLRREAYEGEVPLGVQVITAGVDTQDDRLEVLVIGWGLGEEAWLLERVSLAGDPGRADVWLELDELLAFDWPHAEGGALRIQCTLVDAGGHRTQGVYTNVIPRQAKRVFAAFGRSGGERGQLVSPPKPIRPANGTGNVLRRIVDVDQAKALLFSRLRLVEPGPEFIHFPMSVDQTFFDELTAERLVTKRNRFGVPTKVWERTRDRNESLDCAVLALAALRILAPTPARFEKLAADIQTHRMGIAPAAARPDRPRWLDRR